MRFRVVGAMLLLAAAKGLNVVVPIIYKFAVDALDGKASAIVVVPIALLVAYGLARVLSLTFGELRDAVFAKVAQRAIRDAGLKTFRYLHKLALAFHLDRQTGGLSRAVERGTKGIQFVLNFALFNVIPTSRRSDHCSTCCASSIRLSVMRSARDVKKTAELTCSRSSWRAASASFPRATRT